MENLRERMSGSIIIKGIILESSASFCMDMWAGVYKVNADGLVGTEMSLTINNWNIVNIAVAPKAEWKIKGINGNILDIGFLHIEIKNGKPNWGHHGKHDLLIDVREIIDAP